MRPTHARIALKMEIIQAPSPRRRGQVPLTLLALDPSTMNCLPLETLQHIFELACTDAGFTGNSLSLTSKQMRAAARRSRFHILRLSDSSDHFRDFVAFLEHECTSFGHDERPHVRHLFLTITCHLLEEPVNVAQILQRLWQSRRSTTSPQAAPPPNNPVPQQDTPAAPPLRSREHAVQELVRLVAPDLWSLVIDAVPDGWRNHFRYPNLEYEFPLVREVAFIGVPWPTDLLNPKGKRSPVFPLATHLHLSSHLYRNDLQLSAWYVSAPHITHLRISGIVHEYQVKQIADAVGVALSVSTVAGSTVPSASSSGQRGAPLPRTLLGIRYLILEPMPRLPGTLASHAIVEEGVERGLRDIARGCRHPDIDIQVALLAKPKYAPYGRQVRRLHAKWTERIEGGEGWWRGLSMIHDTT